MTENEIGNEVKTEETQETPAAEVPAVEEAKNEAPAAEAAPAVEAKSEAPAPKAEVNEAEILNFASVEDDDDFDWEAEEDEYSADERAKFEAMYENSLNEVQENEIVPGTVVAIGDKEVILNIGFKSEGVVSVSEFRDLPDLKIGDEVEVYLESVEDQDGQLILSRKRAKHMRTWARILAAETEDIVLQGHIKRRTKGGFVVDIDGIEAFLPGSQIDVKPVRDFDAYVGKIMDFKVVKINHPFENVVISHKVLIEKDLEKQRQEILKNLERGQVLEGTVKNMTNFGVFIDLGGVDGLLHITDISWGRINHPEEVLELDQKINIVVLDFDDDKKRISLGLKQLEPHPWDSLPEDIQEGSRIKGRVVTVADYGIFVEIMPGVEGLVHMSEISYSQHLKNISEMFKIDDEVEAVVLSIDRDERKMSLGIKQILDDPWDNAADNYSVGSRHKGIVRNMTNYGLFVELEEGVDGLVHISDLSWTKKYNHPSEFIRKDEQLEVVVLEIDVANRRLSLGHKQLTEDLWETFETLFVVGSSHKGTLLNVSDRGATVELEYGVEGFIPGRHLETAEGQSKLRSGDGVDLVVIEFNKDAKKLVLSHAMTWNTDLAEEHSRSKKRGKSSGGGGGQGKGKKASSKGIKQETTTLGDIAALAALKQQMEAAEKGGPKTAPKAKAEAPKAKAPEPAPEAPAAEEAKAETPAASSEEE